MPFISDSSSPTHATSEYSGDHRSKMRKSIFGSVKEKFTRKSTSSQKSNPSAPSTGMPASNNPFAAAPIANSKSPPTISIIPPISTAADRRPGPDQPPPAYSVSPAVPSGTGFLGANGGPVRSSSPTPSNAGSIMSLSGMSVSTPEDPYAFLTSFDTIFVVDDSGSMSGRSWPEVQGVLRAITPICTAHDADGIDLYFLNHKTSASANPRDGKAAGGYYSIKRAETVEGIFTSVRPRGATPTGQRLHAILKPYLQLLESKKHDVESVKPINVIIITDGAPSDDVESTIISAAKKLDRLDAPLHQIGVQFFQVGNEPGAREALRELDDDLVERADCDLRDMVDTVTWENGSTGVLTADSILKVVLGAVVRRLDRRRTSGEVRR
ncbi:von willebrand factor [Colletotrichum musicola]|uniref:von willebrand factor n=1 Tax=Colletotrichum musicola TaxID=2175873 RepID=A0A8H6NWR5_9PEZI|nr:von willebrand factor [Colletotrichum musicola]